MNDFDPHYDWHEPAPADVRHARKVLTLLGIGVLIAAGAILFALN